LRAEAVGGAPAFDAWKRGEDVVPGGHALILASGRPAVAPTNVLICRCARALLLCRFVALSEASTEWACRRVGRGPGDE
jgi:hypothetical protein